MVSGCSCWHHHTLSSSSLFCVQGKVNKPNRKLVAGEYKTSVCRVSLFWSVLCGSVCRCMFAAGCQGLHWYQKTRHQTPHWSKFYYQLPKMFFVCFMICVSAVEHHRWVSYLDQGAASVWAPCTGCSPVLPGHTYPPGGGTLRQTQGAGPKLATHYHWVSFQTQSCSDILLFCTNLRIFLNLL